MKKNEHQNVLVNHAMSHFVVVTKEREANMATFSQKDNLDAIFLT